MGEYADMAIERELDIAMGCPFEANGYSIGRFSRRRTKYRTPAQKRRDASYKEHQRGFVDESKSMDSINE